MSKSGRSASDRKKVEILSTSKNVTVADCGTVFILNSGSTADGAYTATLPSVNDAGNGWWCKFVIGETTGGDVLISASADDLGSVNVHKPMSRNDTIYGWGALYNGPYPPMPVATAAGPLWGNLPFVPPNITAANSVRFTISSSAAAGCMQDNLAYYGYDQVQPSASCMVNDTLELVTDGARWYGQVQLGSSVALLDGATNPCTVLSASFAPGYP